MVMLLRQAPDPFAQLSAPAPSTQAAAQHNADPFAGAFSAPAAAPHAALGPKPTASRAAPAPMALSDDFFSAPAQPGPFMGGMQV